jgi:threonine/homoserine efflux transporter RhtA
VEGAPVTLVVNILIYAAIALVPLGLAAAFIRLGRRFSSTS